MNPLLDFVRLARDDWNRDHVGRHGVTPGEVEAVLAGEYMALESYKGRTFVIGANRPSLVLAVVVGPMPNEPGACYVFTARHASLKGRRYCSQQQGGTQI